MSPTSGVAGAVDPNVPGGSPAAAPTAGSGQPNFFERMLPTAGSILGGIVGLPLNALDAVSGIGGTALDAGAAAAGGGLGKALENALTHQSLGAGVGASALEGGIGQGVGEGIGALGGALLGKVGGLADTGTSKLIQGQFARGTMDAGTAGTLNDMGITNAKQVADLYPMTSALNNGVQRGFEEAGVPADLSNLPTTAKNLVSANQMQLAPSGGAAAGSISDIDKTVQSALLGAVNPEDVSALAGGKGKSVVNVFAPGALKNVLPENAFKVTQNFEALANKAYQGAYDKMGNVNPDQLAKYNIFKGLANESRSASFGGDTPIPLSDANKAQIISDLAPMKDTNPAAYNWHVAQVSNAQNLQDLRPIQAPLVKANHALNATQKMTDVTGGMRATDVAKMAAPLAGSVAAGPVGLVGGLAASALGHQAADRVGASTLSRVTDLLTNPTMQKAVEAAAPPAAQLVANSSNDIAQPQGGSMMPTNGAAPGMPSAGGMPAEVANPLLQLYNAILAQSQSPTGISGNLISTANTLAPAIQKQELAAPAIGNLLSTYQNAGGPQGLGGGLLSKLTGAIPGTPANTFNQQSGAAAAQLASILGISPEAAAALLPQLTQTPGTAAPQIGNLQSVLGGIGSPAGAY